jgi:hypothetical protein
MKPPILSWMHPSKYLIRQDFEIGYLFQVVQRLRENW